jgi:hypothetical protein
MHRLSPPDRTPDFEQFLKVLRRERPDRPVVSEMFVGWSALREAAGNSIPDYVPHANNHAMLSAAWS